jgi:DNA-binding phage protein
MLRLVHPPPEGQGPRPPRWRRASALFLSAAEALHLRIATRNAARAYGGVEVLAAVSGVPAATLYNVIGDKGRRPSAAVALRVAKAAGMSVEVILGGHLSEAGRCPTCGSRVGDRPAIATGGDR